MAVQTATARLQPYLFTEMVEQTSLGGVTPYCQACDQAEDVNTDVASFVFATWRFRLLNNPSKIRITPLQLDSDEELAPLFSKEIRVL